MDVANLPFKSDAFDAVVSLHTIHHLPEAEHLRAFDRKTGRELWRVNAEDANQCGCNITGAPLVALRNAWRRRSGSRSAVSTEKFAFVTASHATKSSASASEPTPASASPAKRDRGSSGPRPGSSA